MGYNKDIGWSLMFVVVFVVVFLLWRDTGPGSVSTFVQFGCFPQVTRISARCRPSWTAPFIAVPRNVSETDNDLSETCHPFAGAIAYVHTAEEVDASERL